jgi:hypothetical protein
MSQAAPRSERVSAARRPGTLSRGGTTRPQVYDTGPAAPVTRADKLTTDSDNRRPTVTDAVTDGCY